MGYTQFPTNSSSGVPTYANLAAFPSVANDGDTGIALNTDTLYIYNLASATWLPVGSPSSAMFSGALDGAAGSPKGFTLGSNTIYMQSATAVFPGLVSSFTQTFAGKKTFNAGIDVGSTQITSVADPTTAQQAATKNYVDTQLAAFQPLEAVALASTIDYPGVLLAGVLTVTATGAISIDGSTPAAGARVLIKNQVTQAQNGVYVVTTVGSIGVAPVLTRAGDYNTAAEVNAGASIPVISGTVNKFTAWIQTATVVTIDTDALVFTQYSANPQNVPIAVGALDNAASSINAAVIGSSSLYLQSASATQPGVVSSGNQTIAGVKTFNASPLLNSLTASTNIRLDANKNITNGSVSLTGEVVGNLPLSQTQGSLSLTAQVVGNLPLSQTQGSITSTQLQKYPSLTMGSITQTSSVGGAVYTVTWPGAQGALNQTNVNDGSGNMSWQTILTNPMTQVGDMLVGGSASAISRLAVGGVGQMLIQNATPTPAWTNAFAFQNLAVNSGFDYWQPLGFNTKVTWTIGTTSTNYVCDQFYVFNALGGTGTAGVVTCSATSVLNATNAQNSNTTLLKGSIKGMAVFVSTAPVTAPAAGNVCELWQTLDNQTTIGSGLGSTTFSLAIPIKALAAVNQVGISVWASATEIRAVGSTSVSAINVIPEVLFTVTSASMTICSLTSGNYTTLNNAGSLGYKIRVSGVSSGNTYDVNNGYLTEQHMINVGSVPMPWTRRAYIPGQELSLCQTFYEKSYDLTVLPGSLTGSQSAGSIYFRQTQLASAANPTMDMTIPFKVPKRIDPVMTFYTIASAIGGIASGKLYDNVSGSEISTPLNFSVPQIGMNSFALQVSGSGTSVVTSFWVQGHWQADARL